MTNKYSLDTFPNGLVIKQTKDGFRTGTASVLLEYFFTNFILQKNTHSHILDAGSGTGYIGLSILKNHSETHVTALERQLELCQLSLENATLNQCHNRYNVINDTIINIHKRCTLNSFNYCISNPPFFTLGKGLLPKNHTRKNAHFGSISLKDWLIKCLYPLPYKGTLVFICRTESLNEVILALHNRVGNLKIHPINYNNSKQFSDDNSSFFNEIIITCQKGVKTNSKIMQPISWPN